MIISISDIHLGDRGPRDNFNYKDREPRIYKFLDWVEKQQAQLIVQGDLMEFWQINMSACINAYKDLLNRLDSMQAIYITGNHDNSLVHLINTNYEMPHPFFKRMVKPFQQIIGNRKFYFFHGHEFDPYCNKSNPALGDIATILAGMVEDLNGSPFITEPF